MDKEIPQWVIDYNNANHQSGAGKAIKILMDRRDREIAEFKTRLKNAIAGRNLTYFELLDLIDNL